MKLLARLKRAEAAAAEAQRPAAVGLVWSDHDVRIDRGDLAPGEYVATDVHITGQVAEVTTWRAVERITRDAGDGGVVYGVDGRRVGRVLAVEGSVVRLDLDRAEGAGARA